MSIGRSVTDTLEIDAGSHGREGPLQYIGRQLGRMRFQLPIGIAAAVVAPAWARDALEQFADPLDQYNYSMLGTLFALALGLIVFRKLAAFPGLRASAFIVPSFLIAYMTVIVGFGALRLDFSRRQFLLSFVLCVATYYLIYFLVQRARRLRFALAPFGDVTLIKGLDGVDCRDLATPGRIAPGEAIVADLRANLSPDWERFIADSALAGLPVYNAKHVFESVSGRVQIEHLSENPFGTLEPNMLYSSAKRACDFLLALVALIMLAPALIWVGAAIRADSPGPAIFRQRRIGLGGRPFTVWKFRTMHVDPPADFDARRGQMTAEDDPRITKLGRFLRRSRIDELPQIVNVLLGEMSWIGPRPEALQLSEWYESHIPFYRYRHIVRPGISGWAQVNQGHVTSLEDVDLKLQYDFYYVKNFSLWLDLLVLIRTIRVVLSGFGAR